MYREKGRLLNQVWGRRSVIRAIDKFAAKHPRIALCVAIVIAVICLSLKNDPNDWTASTVIQDRRVSAPEASSGTVAPSAHRTAEHNVWVLNRTRGKSSRET
jgi:hypothetical protein